MSPVESLFAAAGHWQLPAPPPVRPVAVALIGAERMEMPDGELRDLLTGIWSDEVGHWKLAGRLR